MPQIRDRGLSISAFPFRTKDVASGKQRGTLKTWHPLKYWLPRLTRLLKTAAKATAETMRASCENRLPSGLKDGWFSAFERGCSHMFSLLVTGKMKDRVLYPCLSASPPLPELPVLGSSIVCSDTIHA